MRGELRTIYNLKIMQNELLNYVGPWLDAYLQFKLFTYNANEFSLRLAFAPNRFKDIKQAKFTGPYVIDVQKRVEVNAYETQPVTTE